MNDKQTKLKKLIKTCVDDIEESSIDLLDESLDSIFEYKLKIIENACKLIRLYRKEFSLEDRRLCSRCGSYEDCNIELSVSYYDKHEKEFLLCDDCEEKEIDHE